MLDLNKLYILKLGIKGLEICMGKKYLPGVSITFMTLPSFLTHDCNSADLVTPEELVLDLNALLPRILFPVALFPFPVRPINTNVSGETI